VKRDKLEDELFKYGIICVPLAAVGYFLFYWFVQVFNLQFLEECQMLRVFGIYCPGCGGTRAIRYLMRGEIIKSIYYHPVVIYGVVMYLSFMFSRMAEYISKGKIKGMKWRNIYIYIALFIIVINFIVKNIALLKYNVIL